MLPSSSVGKPFAKIGLAAVISLVSLVDQGRGGDFDFMPWPWHDMSPFKKKSSEKTSLRAFEWLTKALLLRKTSFAYLMSNHQTDIQSTRYKYSQSNAFRNCRLIFNNQTDKYSHGNCGNFAKSSQKAETRLYMRSGRGKTSWFCLHADYIDDIRAAESAFIAVHTTEPRQFMILQAALLATTRPDASKTCRKLSFLQWQAQRRWLFPAERSQLTTSTWAECSTWPGKTSEQDRIGTGSDRPYRAAELGSGCTNWVPLVESIERFSEERFWWRHGLAISGNCCWKAPSALLCCELLCRWPAVCYGPVKTEITIKLIVNTQNEITVCTIYSSQLGILHVNPRPCREDTH